MSDYTDHERDTVRRAAFGSMALVSVADPGFFATFKESAAGSQALAQAPQEIRELLQGGLMAPPQVGSKEELESSILSQVREAVAILGAKDPDHVAGFRQVIESAMAQVAEASKGTSSAEQAVIDKVRAALAGETPPAEAPPAE